MLVLALFPLTVQHDSRNPPNAQECPHIDPHSLCTLRVNNASVHLEKLRTCSDIALIESVNLAVPDYDITTPLRKSIWKGFLDNVCALRETQIVVQEDDLKEGGVFSVSY